MLIYIIIYTLLIALILVNIFIWVKLFEFIYCAHIRHQPPLVSSTKTAQKNIIKQINTKYPNAKNICEVGSGFGGLARAIARDTNSNVYALENMPFSAFISITMDKILHCKRNKTIWCDAFKFLDNTKINFDIAVAYLGPTATPKIHKYKNKIKVLISQDFEIKNLVPKYVINLGKGYTIYNKKKYPHRLFIYEFDQIP